MTLGARAKRANYSGGNFNSSSRLILASRSPQRRAILEQLGIPFEVRPADVDERTAGPPEEVVTENALLKARAVANDVGPGRIVLSVDTVVALDDRLYGKASDSAEARSHLERLSGREHEVWSGLVLVEDGSERSGAARTAVRFRELDEQTRRLVSRQRGVARSRRRIRDPGSGSCTRPVDRRRLLERRRFAGGALVADSTATSRRRRFLNNGYGMRLR